MKSDLAIAALIRSRMTVGLSRGEFAKRLGYKNIAKGIRRTDVLCDGDLEGTKHFLDVLPQALKTSAETVKLALEQTVRELELQRSKKPKRVTKSGGRIFVRMPSSLQSGPCLARFSWPRSSGVEKLLRIDLDATQGSFDGVLTVFGVYRRGRSLPQTFQKKRLRISRAYNTWRIPRVLGSSVSLTDYPGAPHIPQQGVIVISAAMPITAFDPLRKFGSEFSRPGTG
ncbi:MAG TPA: hypothetical protein VGZ25_00825, partial [Gemmataceae bacterium]|nr:hypothetical protein [Gemmataceae bacterium]